MLSNHYYDKSELLNPDMIGGLKRASEALFEPRFHNPTSRPISLGVYSNAEEADEDEESSLYEAVDRRPSKLVEVGLLPPVPHPPQVSSPSQQIKNSLEMVSWVASFNYINSGSKLKQYAPELQRKRRPVVLKWCVAFKL